jgi:hypothetical protein
MPLEEEEAAAATATNINCRISINTLLMSIQGVGFSVGKRNGDAVGGKNNGGVGE